MLSKQVSSIGHNFNPARPNLLSYITSLQPNMQILVMKREAYGGMSPDMIRQLRAAQKENTQLRSLDEGVLEGIPADVGVSASDNPGTEAARKAIMESVRGSCSVPLSEALDIQAKHSAGFTVRSYCMEGSIGADRARTMLV
jgi:hypothetical protein